MTALLNQIQPRIIFFLIVATFLITVLAAYAYLFKREVLEISRLRSEKHEMLHELKGQEAQDADTRIRSLRREIDELNAALYGQGGQMTPSQLVSFVISKLDGLSVDHGVQLVSVKPEATTRRYPFEETPFAIEARGSYLALYAWLQEAERDLHPMVVKQFQLSSASRGGSPITMALRVVSYRLLEDGV